MKNDTREYRIELGLITVSTRGEAISISFRRRRLRGLSFANDPSWTKCMFAFWQRGEARACMVHGFGFPPSCVAWQTQDLSILFIWMTRKKGAFVTFEPLKSGHQSRASEHAMQSQGYCATEGAWNDARWASKKHCGLQMVHNGGEAYEDRGAKFSMPLRKGMTGMPPKILDAKIDIF